MTTPEARLDLGRSKRIDLPEAVYCQSKTTEQCVSIVSDMIDRGHDAVIATRATSEQQNALLTLEPTSHADSTLIWRPRPPSSMTVAVVAAGTSDLPVANECRLTLEALGHTTIQLTDVGVAGLHRLLEVVPKIESTDVAIAFAGMEGALPTVLAGLIRQPIIAVPTSVGYGTAFEGQTALLSMMTSCAPGIAVVGIDNGYGAACAAHRMLQALAERPATTEASIDDTSGNPASLADSGDPNATNPRAFLD